MDGVPGRLAGKPGGFPTPGGWPVAGADRPPRPGGWVAKAGGDPGSAVWACREAIPPPSTARARTGPTSHRRVAFLMVLRAEHLRGPLRTGPERARFTRTWR